MEKTCTQGFSKNFIPQELNSPCFDLTKWKNAEEENKSDVWDRKILGILKKKSLSEFVNEGISTLFKGIGIMSFLNNSVFLGCGAKGYIVRIK